MITLAAPQAAPVRPVALLQTILRFLRSRRQDDAALSRLSERHWQDVGLAPSDQARMKELRILDSLRDPEALLWRRLHSRGPGS